MGDYYTYFQERIINYARKVVNYHDTQYPTMNIHEVYGIRDVQFN